LHYLLACPGSSGSRPLRSRCTSPIIPPPHFHVLGRDGAAQVAIETLEVIAISGQVDLREALDWAAANTALLRAKWKELSE
jgi:hypothetical protein